MALDPPDALLKKARDDERLLLLVYRSSEASSEQVGFFAQQAVEEKSVKSVLTRHGVTYRRTHDLSELIDLLDERPIAFPDELRASVALTPFAAQLRYDDLPQDEEARAPFDRSDAVQLASRAVAWAAMFSAGTDNSTT